MVCSCNNPRLDLARLESIGVNNDKLRYREVAKNFIRYAKEADLDEMIQLTSPLVLNLKGRKIIMEEYRNKIIPAVRNSQIKWDHGSKIIFDLNYNVGLEFSGIIQGSTSIPFFIAVFKEHGKLVVVNIRRTKSVRQTPHWGERGQ